MKTPSLSHNGVEETTGAFEMAELQPQDFEDETPAATSFEKAIAEHLYLFRVLCLAIFTLCFAFQVSSTGREDEASGPWVYLVGLIEFATCLFSIYLCGCFAEDETMNALAVCGGGLLPWTLRVFLMLLLYLVALAYAGDEHEHDMPNLFQVWLDIFAAIDLFVCLMLNFLGWYKGVRAREMRVESSV